MSHPDDAKPPDEWRALDAPFRQREEWHPIPGTCSRCGAHAWLGESKWWHATGKTCPSKRPAEFLPISCPDCEGSRDCATCEGHGHLDGERCTNCESLGICPTCRDPNT